MSVSGLVSPWQVLYYKCYYTTNAITGDFPFGSPPMIMPLSGAAMMCNDDTLRSEYPAELIRSGERGKYARRYREEGTSVLPQVLCLVHGMQEIIEGSGPVFANLLPVARVVDLISCGARIIEGSPDECAGD